MSVTKSTSHMQEFWYIFAYSSEILTLQAQGCREHNLLDESNILLALHLTE
jgi:hypothetical protein